MHGEFLWGSCPVKFRFQRAIDDLVCSGGPTDSRMTTSVLCDGSSVCSKCNVPEGQALPNCCEMHVALGLFKNARFFQNFEFTP